MSLSALTVVFERSEQSGSAMLVMLAIADSINRETQETWLSLDYLAGKARISRRTLIDTIPQLEKAGELHVDRGAGPNGCNVYRLGLHYLVGGAKSAPLETPHADLPDGVSGTDGMVLRSGVQVDAPDCTRTVKYQESSLRSEEPEVLRGKGASQRTSLHLCVRCGKMVDQLHLSTVPCMAGPILDPFEERRS